MGVQSPAGKTTRYIGRQCKCLLTCRRTSMAYYFIIAVFISGSLLSQFCFGTESYLPIAAPPAELQLDSFYTKYLDCGGITVVSSGRVEDRAFYRLKALLDKMLENRPDVRKTLAEQGNRFIIISHEEQVTDIPDYADMKPKAFWNERARGFGGQTTSVGEENLLSLPEDRYSDESIFIHELAHSIHFALRKIESDFHGRLETLYKNAMAKGLYKYDYASTDEAEYWAEAVQCFFDCNRENNWNHNHINTREELTQYDPDIVELVRKTFRITPENDWRYTPLAQQPSVNQTPEKLNADPSLVKYVWCRGFSIFGTEGVSDEAMLCVENTVRNMFRYRHDILKVLINANFSIVVLGDEENPGCLSAQPRFDAEMFVEEKEGKTAARLPIEYHLTVRQSDALRIDGGPISKQGKLIGDMALAAYFYAGLRPEASENTQTKDKQQYELGLTALDVRFDQRVGALYWAAMEKGMWSSTPAAENRFMYFAEGVRSFFDANELADKNGQSLNTREQLVRYDPELAALIGDVFKHTERYDWRFSACKP